MAASGTQMLAGETLATHRQTSRKARSSGSKGYFSALRRDLRIRSFGRFDGHSPVNPTGASRGTDSLMRLTYRAFFFFGCSDVRTTSLPINWRESLRRSGQTLPRPHGRRIRYPAGPSITGLLNPGGATSLRGLTPGAEVITSRFYQC